LIRAHWGKLRRCTLCHEMKPRIEFGGKGWWCRDCIRARTGFLCKPSVSSLKAQQRYFERHVVKIKGQPMTKEEHRAYQSRYYKQWYKLNGRKRNPLTKAKTQAMSAGVH